MAAAGVGAVPDGFTGRRIGVCAGAALFIVTVLVVAYSRMKRYDALARVAARAGKHDVLQSRAVTVRNWRRGHRWWLAAAFLAALGSAFAVPVAGAPSSRARARACGRRPPASAAASRTATYSCGYASTGSTTARAPPAGKAVRAFRTTGPVAGDAAPGGARRRTAAGAR